MQFIDFFAGIGGMRLGLERAGHKCVGWCEFDKFARRSYAAIHNTDGEWTASDIRAIGHVQFPPVRTFGHSAFRARTYRQRGSNAVLQVSEADFFTRLSDYLQGRARKIDPNGLSLKMLKIFCLLGEVLTLPECCVRWEKLGSNANGSCSTARISEFRRTGKECSLSDILEESVPEKYFLSNQQTAKILANCKS